MLLATLFAGLLYAGRAYWAWVLALGGALAAWATSGVGSPELFAAAVGTYSLAALVFGLAPLRRRLVTMWLMRLVARMLPRMGDTERVALLALQAIVFPLGARFRPPSDALGARVARALLEDREERLRLTRDIYVPASSEPGLGRLEAALDLAVEALGVETRIRDAVRAGRIDRAPGNALVELALAAGVITEEERRRVSAAEEAREEVIQVDAFEPAAYRSISR